MRSLLIFNPGLRTMGQDVPVGRWPAGSATGRTITGKPFLQKFHPELCTGDLSIRFFYSTGCSDLHCPSTRFCGIYGLRGMLFINPATDTKQAKDYFTRDLSRPDYYLKDASEIAGEWHGRGAERLGLYGKVDKDRYFQLCDNINPSTGLALTPHTRGDRRILYDLTLDAPKSVSLAYELGGDERIMDAFRGAAQVRARARSRTSPGRGEKNRALPGSTAHPSMRAWAV